MHDYVKLSLSELMKRCRNFVYFICSWTLFRL